MSTTKNPFGISDYLGEGGAGLSPHGSGPTDGLPNLRGLLRLVMASIFQPYASVTALTASLAKNRGDGQIAVEQDTYTLWVWKAASADAASATVIAPTDVGAGAGRWEQLVGPGGIPNIQVGQAVLAVGTTGALPATVTANSRFFFGRHAVNASTALGELTANTIVVGAPGSFKIVAATLATPGTPLAGDLSTVDWLIIG